MNHPYFSKKGLKTIFYEYNRENVFKTFCYLILTGGIYAIFWIYYHNKLFEEIDDNAPNSARGAVILFFIPLSLFLLFIIIMQVFLIESLAVDILEILLWGLSIFLTLKYTFEFCSSLAKITMTSTLPWYLFIYIGYSSYILALFGVYYALFGLFFLFIGIMAMQESMNVIASRVKHYEDSMRFNYMKRSDSVL